MTRARRLGHQIGSVNLKKLGEMRDAGPAAPDTYSAAPPRLVRASLLAT